MRRWHIPLILAAISVAVQTQRDKRQLSIDDLISRALSLVRPIFDTSQPLQYDEMLKKQAIVAVCKEQGMDDGQCKLFSNGFQLIDKFITTIESKTPTKIDEPQRPVIPDPPRRKENDILMDDAEYTAEPVERPKALGSKTWSSQPESGPQLFEVRNDLVASFTPLPPAPFVPPTPPAAPPLAFPTVPSLIIPPFTPAALSFEKLLEMKIEPIIRRQREVDWDTVDLEPDIMQVRVKRDYYDDAKPSEGASDSSSSSLSASSFSSPSSSADYYGSVADSTPTQKVESSPLQNCVHILGIY
ncbi:hypothetical protein Q1695_000321 [Nippostrongylus brasiliensis]|nr:hypothetical protein Q1695_000321 [Nippostrongylus brasiliensis]